MSEKIPISLRNSDLFLKLKLADGNKEEKDVENVKSLILKKGPSLGENNHLRSLHTFSLLKLLQTGCKSDAFARPFSDFNKTVNSSPRSSSFLKSDVKKPSFEKNTNFTNKNQDGSQYTQDRKLKYKTTEVRDTYPLRYKLQTKLTSILFELNDLTEQESKAGLRKQHQRQPGDAGAKLLQRLQKRTLLHNEVLHARAELVQSENEVLHAQSPAFANRVMQKRALLHALHTRSVCMSRFLKLDFYSLYLQSFLYKINRGICSEISQKFSIVAINLILFSVITIVKRSHYGKSSSAINQKHFRTILYTSKLPNLTRWYGMSRNVKQVQRFKNEPGLFANGEVLWWHAKPKQMVGSFLKQLDLSPFANNDFRDTTGAVQKRTGGCTNEVMQKRALLHACKNEVMQKRALLHALQERTLLRAKRSFATPGFIKKGYAIKPYYCIKASNIWNNQITATRSIKQEANNIFYEQQIVPKFQYCISYNTNQHRTFIENDTIPEKRDSIDSKIVTQQHKNKLESSRLTSELLLKRCFYKYGFFLIQFNELNQRTYSNSAVQSEKEGNFFGIRTVGLISQQNQVKSFDNKTLVPPLAQSTAPFLHAPICLKKELVLKGQEKNNKINDSTLNNYINLALYKKKPGLAKRSYAKACAFARIANLLQNAQTWFAQGTGLFISGGSKACVSPGFFSLGLTWSRYNLEKARIVDFVQIKNAVLTFNFKPDTLVKNTSVSGYQFTELQRKQITTLFRKKAIFDTPRNQNSYFFSQAPADNIIFNKQQQISNKVLSLVQSPVACKNEVFTSGEAFYTLHERSSCVQNEVINFVLQALQERSSCVQKQSFCNPRFICACPGLSNVDLSSLSKRSVDPKMQYTQTNLDEIESVKRLFKEMGRDYEDYMRQPKDSLPALIISPSLEDDREIEEEGIRIFRKRNLLKKKNSKGSITNNSKDQAFIDDLMVVESKDNEKQNHQILVKNALRQAQEDIDEIAKKEEKSGEKDKQVIPPLTRLEALYTIRQREKRYEQAKDLKREKGHTQAKLTFTKKSFPIFEQLFLYSDKLKTNFLNDFQFIAIRTPQLLSRLGDDKSNKTIQNRTKFSRVNALRHKQGDARAELVQRLQKRTLLHNEVLRAKTMFLQLDKAPPESKFVQSTDRKHSFFGEMSLPAHKLTAQKQKQVFEQKGDPLVKLNAKNTESVNDKLTTVATVPFSLLSLLSISSKTHNKKLESSRFKVGIVKTNIIAPLVRGFENGMTPLSSLDRTSSHIQRVDAKTELCKSERFCTQSAQSSVGVPDSFVQPAGPKTKSLLKPSLSKKTDQEIKLDRFGWVRGPNRIYFYDNLSQNKACQGSTPKIKATPLGSPVYHRVWQPKRMEPSSFRVLQRSKKTPVVPKISQKDWKNIIEWQLKKHFFEEDKRLWPLDNTNKRFKIKKVNLYLPWISITKTPDNNVFVQTAAVQKRRFCKPVTRSPAFVKSFAPKPGLDLIFVDRKSNGLVNQLHLPENNIATTSFIKNNVEKKQNLVVSLQNNLTKILSGRYNAEIDSRLLSRKEEFWNTNIQRNCQTTHYWRLPTRQNLFSITIPLKAQIKASALLKPTQSFIKTVLGKKNSLALQSENSKQNKARPKNIVFVSPQSQKGVVQKVFKESFLFESATGYSWLFIYAFVSVLMFKQLFKWVYQAGLKDFFIKFLNSDFGRTITSEEFRYSIQNVPLKELYMPSKQLQELFSLDKNKVQLLEVVWFLRNHCQGRHGPRGVLLVGPPGVENISVVQAIAGEAKVPIFVQSLEKIAQDNEPQRQLEQLYMRAHKHAPCVLFLDQLDTIGSRRDQLFTEKARAFTLDYKAKVDLTSPETWAQQVGACKNDVFASGEVLNKLPDTNFSQKKENLTIFKNKLNVVLRLLTILDGITQSSGVVTVATARDITKLDPALLRPKRFDRRIYLSLPNRQDRVQLFKIQTQNIGHIKEMPWDYLSLRTENMSAADIQSAINYSLFRAVLKKSVHTVETLEYGIDCVKTLTEKRVTVM